MSPEEMEEMVDSMINYMDVEYSINLDLELDSWEETFFLSIRKESHYLIFWENLWETEEWSRMEVN